MRQRIRILAVLWPVVLVLLSFTISTGLSIYLIYKNIDPEILQSSRVITYIVGGGFIICCMMVSATALIAIMVISRTIPKIAPYPEHRHTESLAYAFRNTTERPCLDETQIDRFLENMYNSAVSEDPQKVGELLDELKKYRVPEDYEDLFGQIFAAAYHHNWDSLRKLTAG